MRSMLTPRPRRFGFLDRLESRRLFALTASASVTLTATDTLGSAPVYHYDVALTNTGTTTLGTFWFAWTPGADFLASLPTASDPTGWTHSISGENNSTNGSSIEWIASSPSARVAAGATLSGFSFTSADSPQQLAGKSTTHPTTDVLTSFVYSAGPFSDSGFSFKATPPGDTTPPPTLANSAVAVPKVAKSYALGKSLKLSTKVTSPDATSAYTGAVILTEGDEVLGDGSISSKGVITFSSAEIPAGDHIVQLVYSGDAKRDSGTSSTFTLHIPKVTTKTSLKLSNNNLFAGQPLTLTATVTPKGAGSFSPTQLVTFKDGDTVLGTSALTGGIATLTVPHVTVGQSLFSATYAGDDNFAASTSPAKKTKIKQISPKLTLTDVITSPLQDQVPFTLVATFSKIPTGATFPASPVTFKDGDTVLGTALPNENGVASLVVTPNGLGKHTYTASYVTDTNTIAPKPAKLVLKIDLLAPLP